MINLNTNKLRAILGQPGTGKSHKLIDLAVDDILMGHEVLVLTPTHGARDSLRTNIDKAMRDETSDLRIEALKELRYKRIKVLYGYDESYDRVYIEEASQFPDTHFTSLMYRSQRVEGVQITLVGDLKQLPVVKGHSVLELLLSATVTEPVWDWTSQAYANVDFETLTSPRSWYLEHTQIQLTILTKNYRLASQGFDNGYDEEYIKAVIDNAVDLSGQEGQSDEELYRDVVLEAVKSNRLMIALSHKRGKVLDNIVEAEYGVDAIEHFPFVREDTKVYLNPKSSEFKSLKIAMPFMQELPKGVDWSKLELSCYAVPHIVQGVTFDGSPLVFMGNEPINDKASSYYTNNNLYVSLSRGTELAQLVGNRKDFTKMLANRPASMREVKTHVRSINAVKKLFSIMSQLKEEKTFEEIYSLFEDTYRDVKLPADEITTLQDYNVQSEMYNEDQLRMAFKNYPTGFGIDYKAKFYDEYISQKNGSNKAGKVGGGKIQLWVNNLNDEERTDVMKAIEELSVRKFKAQFGYDKRYVMKALGVD